MTGAHVDPWAVVTTVLGLYVAVLAWVGNRHIKRIDDNEVEMRKMDEARAKRDLQQDTRITVLEASVLKKEDLNATEARLMGAMGGQHAALDARLNRIEAEVDNIRSYELDRARGDRP